MTRNAKRPASLAAPGASKKESDGLGWGLFTSHPAGLAREKKPMPINTFPPQPDTLTEENTASAQRARLLSALRRESLTTLEARSKLDVLHPAARVMELRRQGFNIVTAWTTDTTPEGNAHRVARYILRPGEGTQHEVRE